ncbi:putative dehydratase NIT22 [Fusarium oxysporum f. sp. albedinis]|nr:putative dehydratase NIT22 [Fusarium oxysporum f. sp. albedinis]
MPPSLTCICPICPATPRERHLNRTFGAFILHELEGHRSGLSCSWSTQVMVIRQSYLCQHDSGIEDNLGVLGC